MAINPYTNYAIFSGSYSSLVDIMLAMMPWPLIWGLQMKKKEKLGIALAMSLGVFAGITAIMKTVAIPGMVKGDFTCESFVIPQFLIHVRLLTPNLNADDGAQLVIWGNAEVSTTIMAASIPVLRVLFMHAKSSAGRYYETGKKGSGHLGSNMSKNNTTTSASRKAGYMTEGTGTGDDRSDRSILDTSSPGVGKIIQTNEITLEYSDRSHPRLEDREGWYRMNKMDHAV